VFKNDQLVTTFLTIPTELAVWRKQAAVSIQEEFEDRYLAPDLESSLPQGIDDWMYRTRVALVPAIESFTSMVVTQERLIKRQEVAGTDHLRLSLTLNTFCEQQGASYDVLGKEHGSGIVRGLQALSRYHTTAQQIMEQECRALEDAVLEDLKRYRDTLTAMHELFARHAKYAGDNVPSLEKRIASAKNKLNVLDNKPDAKESDKTKQRESIQQDQNTIVKLMSRRIFVKECVWHELQVFEAQQVHISRLVNDLAGLRAEYAKRLMDLATKLQGDVEGMP
jgi:sorting nexin-8